jgi:hypothetical protein
VNAVTAPMPRLRGALGQLAWLEIRRYVLHPLFLLGIAANIVGCITGPDATMSSFGGVIEPAAGIGIVGIVITAGLTRRSDRLRDAAGAVPVSERTRSLALVAACAVPFAAGLIWWGWALAAYRSSPPPANGFPFGPVSASWRAAVLFGEAPVACLGGPLLGVLVGRWLPRRGAAPLVAVGVVAVSIALQGVFDPIRRIRELSPWTYWGGPFGVHGDANRMLVFPGSPEWWVAYLACLCGLAVLGVLAHDREQPRRGLWTAMVVVAVAAAAAAVLSIETGIGGTLVNPLPS